MPSTLTKEPPVTGPTPEELKLERRHSRKAGLFEPELLKTAFRQSLIMLRPDIQWKNPVMFTVEVGTVLTIIYTIAKLLGYQSAAAIRYLLELDFWLVATLLFANFASAIAEARGKAQADALRKTRRATPARRLRADGTTEQAVSTELRGGDRVEVVAGEVIPSDGEIIEGVASIDESAITGESAPVIREAGGDRSGVTGGTRVLSDRIVVEITASPGGSFLDRMIALVEGAIRQRTPNEIALSLVLAAFTLIFLIVTATLWPIAYNVELYMKAFRGGEHVDEPWHRRADIGGPAGVPDSHDDRRSAGRHRHRRHGPCFASQHHGQERKGGGSGGRRGHAACWTRRERSPWATAGRRSSFPSMASPATEVGHLAAQASAADETPEGKSIVELFHQFAAQATVPLDRTHGAPMATPRSRQDRGLFLSRLKRG